jgi:predicted metal-dependent hydrolase
VSATTPPNPPPPGFSAEDWTRFLSRHLGREVRVRYGRARRQVIVAHPERRGLRVRMNQAFERAPHSVRDAVADWLRDGRRARAACRELDRFIADIVPTLGPPRRPPLSARGQCHDLDELYAELVAAEFQALPPERRPSGITWGRRGKRGARRSLLLGSFCPETYLVRIHPVLDQPGVPRSFVRYVLFHECLHAALNEPCGGGERARHHGPEFRRREAAYAGTAEALRWQEANLPALLRSARTEKPLPAAKKSAPLQWLQGVLFGE